MSSFNKSLLTNIHIGLRFVAYLIYSDSLKIIAMLKFKVLFLYYEKTYSAFVQRVSGNPIKYFVSMEPPNNLNFQPFVLTADESTGSIEYGRRNAYGSLAFTILLAVKSYCYDNGIPLLKD